MSNMDTSISGSVDGWKVYPHERGESEWNDALLNLIGYSVFQSYEWGEYRRARGWTVHRFIRTGAAGAIVAMAQCLVRSYGTLLCLAWIPGGPAGGVGAWSSSLPGYLRSYLKDKAVYIRMNAVESRKAEDVVALRASGWNPVAISMGSTLSMRLDLSSEGEALPQATKNWRRNQRRTTRYPLMVELWDQPSAHDLAKIHSEMEEYKGISVGLALEDFEALIPTLRTKVLIYRCSLEGAGVIGIRACAFLGQRAWDLLAATNVQGRTVYASYALLSAVVQHCQRLGIREYDLSGVDPRSNLGVYNFKKGTGAEAFEYLGEWEYCDMALARCAVNVALLVRKMREELRGARGRSASTESSTSPNPSLPE